MSDVKNKHRTGSTSRAGSPYANKSGSDLKKNGGNTTRSVIAALFGVISLALLVYLAVGKYGSLSDGLAVSPSSAVVSETAVYNELSCSDEQTVSDSTVTSTAVSDLSTTAATTSATVFDGTHNNAEYVFKPNYKSPYYIVVFTGSQSTVVYGKDDDGGYTKKIKCFTCSTGAPSSPTRTGPYKIRAKYRWRWLVGAVYGQYSSSISDSYLFHSVPYARNGDLASLDEAGYNALGTPYSHGCIRMCVRDTKWIYDNCPIGTQVYIVNATGPAGESVLPPLINDALHDGWDPTDPDPSNPYLHPNATTTTGETSESTTAATSGSKTTAETTQTVPTSESTPTVPTEPSQPSAPAGEEKSDPTIPVPPSEGRTLTLISPVGTQLPRIH